MNGYILEGFIKIIFAIAVIAALPQLWRWTRFLYKRQRLRSKLRHLCQKTGAVLIPTHKFWMFGDRGGGACDFYIETAGTVYSVKLFSTKRYLTELRFTDDGRYYVRSFIGFATPIVGVGRVPVDSKHIEMINYDFRRDFRPEWYMKRFRPVLLVNPVCYEIRYNTRNDSKIVGAGEMVNGAYVYPLSRFLGELEMQEEKK